MWFDWSLSSDLADENPGAYIRMPMPNMSILLELLVLVPNLILYKVTAKASIFRGFLETAVTSETVRHGL
jgi:hypothetical protein